MKRGLLLSAAVAGALAAALLASSGRACVDAVAVTREASGEFLRPARVCDADGGVDVEVPGLADAYVVQVMTQDEAKAWAGGVVSSAISTEGAHGKRPDIKPWTRGTR